MSDVGGDRAEKSAGQHLRDAREAAGLSIDDVSTKLKLSPKQVLAIETQDWDVLPERTFTRGFFRSYARLVGVDERLVDQAFTRATVMGEMRTLHAGIGEVTAENTTARSSAAKWLIPVALVGALIAGVAWFMRSDMAMPQANSKATSPPATVSSSTLPTKSSNDTLDQIQKSNYEFTGAKEKQNAVSITDEKLILPQKNSGLNEVVGSATLANAAAAVAAPAPPVSVPPTTSAIAAQPVAPAAAQTAPPPSPTPPTLLAAGQKKLSLTVRGRSWTEVRSKGDVVLSEMLSDTSRELAASGPINMVIGNASNVRLTVDGKPYDFSMHVRNEVARFRVE